MRLKKHKKSFANKLALIKEGTKLPPHALDPPATHKDFLLLSGIALLLMGFTLYPIIKHYSLVHKGHEVTAKVSSFDKSRGTLTPHYQYTFQGKVFSAKDHLAWSIFPDRAVGDSLQIYIDPEDPQNISSGLSLSTFSLFGFFTLLYGYTALSKGLSISSRETLKRTSRRSRNRIRAKVLRVVAVGGKRFSIEAQWTSPANSQVYTFYSEGLPFNPSSELGEEIEVIVDAQAPKNYHMPIDFLMKAA